MLRSGVCMNQIKEAFARHLNSALIAFYKGCLPSFSVIARDFTLRAPDLPPVSRETIRHWLRGQSLPHLSRMQVLLSWLGQDLVGFDAESQRRSCHHDVARACQTDKAVLCGMIEKLNRQESEAMLVIVQMLAAQHGLSKTEAP